MKIIMFNKNKSLWKIVESFRIFLMIGEDKETSRIRDQKNP